MTTNFINVVGKYTLENVKELKDNIPVNENNVMDLTSAYIDENELNLKLNEYATKTFVLSETDPLNEDVNNIKNGLETKVSYESMRNYTKEYVDEMRNTFATVDHTHDEYLLPSDITCESINGYKFVNSFSDKGFTFGTPVIPTIKTNSVMEIGQYLDFHVVNSDGTSTTDYNTRIKSDSDGLNILKSGNLQGNLTCGKLQIGPLTIEQLTDEGTNTNRMQLTGAREYRIKDKNNNWINIGGWDYPLMICGSNSSGGADGSSPKFGVNNYGRIKAQFLELNNSFTTSYYTDFADTTGHTNITGCMVTIITDDQRHVINMTPGIIGNSYTDENGNQTTTLIEGGKITCETINANSTLNTVDINISNKATAKTFFTNNSSSSHECYMDSGYLNFVIPGQCHWKMNANNYDNKKRLCFRDVVNGGEVYINGATGYEDLNTTITHNAPVNESIENFQIGAPVFTTGLVYHLSEGKYVSGSLTSIDCITSVKTSGSYRQYLGICCAIHKTGDIITIGDTLKQEVEIKQDTVDFATHGDFYFRVNDSSEYSVGDIVLFDGNKLDDELIMTAKITSSIVGKVTGIIDEHLLCVFKD